MKKATVHPAWHNELVNLLLTGAEILRTQVQVFLDWPIKLYAMTLIAPMALTLAQDDISGR